MFLLCKTRKKAIHLNLSYVSRNHFLVFSLFSSSGFIQVLIGFWRRQWHPTPVLLPRKSHGRRGLVDCSPWGCWESGTTERLHFHFSLSCIGEGNGNPLQCSCLENPRDGEPGGLPSMGSHRVGHDSSDLAAAAGTIFIFEANDHLLWWHSLFNFKKLTQDHLSYSEYWQDLTIN